jgi:uncharacterized protein
MPDVTPAIVHEPQNMRFVAMVGSEQCELNYRLQGRRAVFVHTGVAPRLRGQGIAAALVRQGLDWAAAAGLEVVPACSYVQAYLERQQRRGAA